MSFRIVPPLTVSGTGYFACPRSAVLDAAAVRALSARALILMLSRPPARTLPSDERSVVSANSPYLLTEAPRLVDGPLGAILLLASESTDGRVAVVEHE